MSRPSGSTDAAGAPAANGRRGAAPCLLAFLVLVLALASAAGCGQKGALYLPEDGQEAVDATEAGESPREDEREDDDNGME